MNLVVDKDEFIESKNHNKVKSLAIVNLIKVIIGSFVITCLYLIIYNLFCLISDPYVYFYMEYSLKLVYYACLIFLSIFNLVEVIKPKHYHKELKERK
ncbi:MAG: hypothetical protein LBV53_01415 [Mycoplasmataceae bacterium]|jgi:hypothetical protein|nr:hypothetical protein [Mycoplasmataceae bacterium]